MATEEEIELAVAAHRARNAEIASALTERHVTLSEDRPIDVHFWADDQHDAALLARELFKKGFLIKLLAPAGEDEGGQRWTIEAGALIPPDQILGDRLTEQLVRMAAACGAVYDGWGTKL